MIGQTGSTVDVEAVQIGMTVLALDLENDTDADLVDVRGGIVVSIDTAPDPETGEVRRYFTTAKHWRREVRWSRLAADEVRDVLPFTSSDVRRLIRVMARQVADRKSVLDTDDCRLIDAMAILKEVA